MTKTNLLLLMALALVSMIAYRISQHATAMAQWSMQIPSQAPHPDPRRVAASRDKQVVAAKRQVQGQLMVLRRMIPATRSIQSPIGSANQHRDARDRELSDREASYLLRQPLGVEEIRSIRAKLDPEQVPLPRSVQIFQTAIADWARLRSRWPEPVGQYELSSLIRYGGYTPALLSALDPNIPRHRMSIEEGLRKNAMDARVVVDWLSSGDPLLSAIGDEYRANSYASLLRRHQQIHDEDDSSEERDRFVDQAARWINKPAGTESLSLEKLTLVSLVNHPLLWNSIELRTRPRGATVETLTGIASHSLWHARRIDDRSLPILKQLRGIGKLPPDAAGPDPAADHDDRESGDDVLPADQSMRDAVTSWIAETSVADPDRQDAAYRRLLSIAPVPSLRELVVKFTSGDAPTRETAEALSDALWCRWATCSDSAMLYRHAIVVDRPLTSLDDPDATAEALKTICRERCECAADAARFWIQQPRWPRNITQAWSDGGEAAEIALCEAILATNFERPPRGIQACINAIAGFGGGKSIATLEAIRREADRNGVTTLNRFVNFAISKIRRRLVQRGTP